MKIKGVKRLQRIDSSKKICVMGIGNFDRADDFAGVAVIELLEKMNFPDNIKIINAGPVPEAFTGVIKKEAPNLLIIIDAAQMDEKPGTIRVFLEKDVDEAYMITPHKVSMKMYTKYLRSFLKKLDTLFIGIEPASLSYMVEMSSEVKESIKYLSQFLEDLLRK
jgi:hydrogenase 3 maturation protease